MFCGLDCFGVLKILDEYNLCGWRVSSDFELPELAPWQGRGQPVEVTIRRGLVALDKVHSDEPHGHVVLEHGSLFHVAGVARYWVSGGNEIVIDSSPTAEPSMVRLFLLGTVFGLLCHQRGLVPLHASSVVVAGRAVAFAGRSGVGKSTLAAALGRQGYSVVSDDVCVIEWRSPGLPHVLPFAPKLKLVRDSLSALGLSFECAEIIGSEPEKLNVLGTVGQQREPIPLAAIFHLNIESEETIGKGRQLEQGASALTLLNRNIYRVKPAHQMGRQRALFEATARIAAQVPNHSLTRSSDFSGLEDLIRCVLLHYAA